MGSGLQVQLMGGQVKTPLSAALYRKAPYTTFVIETQLTIGAALAQIHIPLVTTSTYYCAFQNVSAGGQNIRIGAAPSFGAPVAGILIPPTAPENRVIFEDWYVALWAIASAPGALLDVMIFRTSQ